MAAETLAQIGFTTARDELGPVLRPIAKTFWRVSAGVHQVPRPRSKVRAGVVPSLLAFPGPPEWRERSASSHVAWPERAPRAELPGTIAGVSPSSSSSLANANAQ